MENEGLQSKFDLIIYRLDEQKEVNTAFNAKFDCIIEKITGIKDKNASQDVTIEGITKQVASSQAELTDHKNGHNRFIGWIIATAGIISGFVATITINWKKIFGG